MQRRMTARVLDATKIRDQVLRRTQGRNRAPCHRRHSPRSCGGTRPRNPASYPYVKNKIAACSLSFPDERIEWRTEENNFTVRTAQMLRLGRSLRTTRSK